MAKRVYIPSETVRQQKLEQAMQIAVLIREQTLAQECEESLKTFTRESWAAVSPGSPFTTNWHIDAICEHLEALARREIKKLIINVPPRSLKSTLISVIFPAWRWLRAPEEKFVSVSYSRSLSLRDSRRARALIMSQWYQARWRGKFELTKDQNEKGRFENNGGGYRLAASVEGGVLGEGASFLLIDDANDLEKMQYPDYRQGVKDWYSNSLASRYIDPMTDVRLNVQQRSSYGDDLTQYLLDLGGWEHLVIPNEFDGVRRVSSIGWTDPRTSPGELMHPERLGPVETEDLKRSMGPNYQGQFNQIPASLTGGHLKRGWFNFWTPQDTELVDLEGKPKPVVVKDGGKTLEKTPRVLPSAFEQVVQSWDMAFKDEAQGSKVAAQVWGRVGSNCYLLARSTKHRDFPETLHAMRKWSGEFPCPEKLVEDKANGPAVIQTLKNEIPGLIPVNPEGGKYARVAAISGYVEAGNVWLPNPDLWPWVWDLLAELCGVPKDDTDAATQALKRLFDSQAQQGAPEFRVEPRVGEPQTACHVMEAREVLPGWWRRFVVVVPGSGALWMVETPSGALRVVKEARLEGISAEDAGRAVAEGLVPTILGGSSGPVDPKRSVEVFLPKPAFAPVEPHGSWAELHEASLLAYVPEVGDYDYREQVKAALKAARIRLDQIEEDDSALDRLRGLLAFQPPDFERVPYDRQKALALSRSDIQAYSDYMAQVEGEARGEWPKIKISPECKELISQMGGFRRDRLDDAPGLVRVLLLAVCAPLRWKPSEIREGQPKASKTEQMPRPGRGNLLGRKFAMGRR